jgi:hypothetical protein
VTDTRGELTGHVQPGSIGILAMCEPWMKSSHSLCATRHAKIILKGSHFNDAPPFDRLKRLEGVKRVSAIQKSYNFPLPRRFMNEIIGIPWYTPYFLEGLT